MISIKLSLNYVPLHAHSTEGSPGDSILNIKEYVKRCKEWNMPAAALTDHGTMAMAYQFYDECVSQGIKPIIGCEVYVTKDRTEKQVGKDEEKQYHHLVLLAKNKTGFQNLLRITNDAHEVGFYFKPRTDDSVLKEYGGDLIALSACVGGRIPQMILSGQDEELIIEEIRRHQSYFDGFYLEIQPGDFDEQTIVNAALIDLSQKTGTPLVVTTDVHYLDQEDSYYHDCHVKIGFKHKLEDPMVYPDDCCYLHKPKDLLHNFSADNRQHVMSAMRNTLKIAEKCQLDLSTNEVHMPRFAPDKDEDKMLEDLTFQNLEKIMQHIPSPEVYTERVLYELSVIKELGFSGYFLSVYDFINYARQNNIGVGPGRGSVGGSLVSYLLGISLADPIENNLLFERFLSVHRKSMPDIDLDFDSSERYRLFLYAQEKYGQENTCLISTFMYRKAKKAIVEVGRLVGLSEAEIKNISATIPKVYYEDDGDKNADVDLSFALSHIRELKQYRKEYPELFEIALRLEGIPTGFSRHPAGVLISTEKIGDYLPLTKPHDELGISITSLNLEDSESRGFLKYDFLSLSTLNVIENTMRETKQFDYLTDTFDDKKVWSLIGTKRSAGLFQISSFTYKKRMPKLKPKNIQELSNCLALIRGPAISSGSDQLYIDIINGKREPVHIHDLYWEATKDTYGVLIFQEQLMQIAVNFGLSLEDGYHIVKSAARKKFDVLESYKEEFYERGRRLGVPQKAVDEIFKLIVQSGQYLFNSSHAVSYALLCYASAWLKTHYPRQFLKNLLTNAYVRKKEKEIKEIYNDLKYYKINVLPVDVNTSQWEMSEEGESILTGFVALQNLGEKAAEWIVSARPFTSFDDFYEKVKPNRKTCNKKAIIALIMSGAFDSFEKNRVALYRRFLTKEPAKPDELEAKIIKVTTGKVLHLNKNNKHFEQMYMGRPA